MSYSRIDAYGAAQSAYFKLNPDASEPDWKNWLIRTEAASKNGTDDTDALAELCLDCAYSEETDIDRSLLVRIAQAAGYFQATSAIVDQLAYDERIELVD